MYELLSLYYNREGNVNVPYNHKEEGENLGTWLAYQKKSSREGRLSEEKVEKLNILGVVQWANNPSSDTRLHSPTSTSARRQNEWDSMLVLLQQYKIREGDVFVPQNHAEWDSSRQRNFQLGNWLYRQRRKQAQGKLNASNEKDLESLGVVFGKDIHLQKWEDMYNRLVEFQNQEGHLLVPQNYRDKDGKSLGTWVNTQRQSKRKGTLDPSFQARLQALDGFVWTTASPQWDAMFLLLKEYVSKEGHCNVPRRYSVSVPCHTATPYSSSSTPMTTKRLGQWVDRQRQAKKAGTMLSCRESKLNRLGMVWDLTTQHWEDMFSRLQEYKEKEGHCDVPRDYHIEVPSPNSASMSRSKNLGTWLHSQRRFRRLKQLDPVRVARLEAIGIEWDPSFNDWKSMHSLLVKYREREGNCLVPQSHKENGRNLGTWLNNQRSKHKSGCLDKMHVDALEELGVVWDVSSAQWKTMISLLKKYKQKHDHCRVPQSYEEDGKRLGTWLNTQRQAKRSGSLDLTKIEELESIGVVWDVVTDKWEEMFSLLQEYKHREGDCMVSQRHKENGKALGVWLSLQRKARKEGTLDCTREMKLNETGVVWDVLPYKWDHMFSKLLQYKLRQGDCKVPLSHIEDGKSLGIWLDRQRKLKKAGKLDASLEERLMTAGVTFDLNRQKWDAMFDLLVSYKEREGHCRVPQGHKEKSKNLGSWLDSQRQKKKKGKLNEILLARLENLGVEWTIYHANSGEEDDNWGFEGMDHLFDDNLMVS